MDVLYKLKIDWNEAAAVEFLGPPGYNVEYRAAIQDILNNLGTMTGHIFIDWPTDWSINVRCDDWLNYCGRLAAYTVNRGPKAKATINFCNNFFKEWDLDEQVSKGRNTGDFYWKYDMRSYERSKGEALHWSRKKEILSIKILTNLLAVTFLHELLHISWVYKKSEGRKSVEDYQIVFYDPDEEKEKVELVYGPVYSKILARWYSSPMDPKIGRIIARSAENLALYSLAMYLTVHLGAYPHLPFVNTQPRFTPRIPDFAQPFIVADNGTVFSNSTYQDEGPGLVNATTILINQFTPNSEYPSSYITDWNYWANPGTQMSTLVSHWILVNSAH
jgi:hypothetical protein